MIPELWELWSTVSIHTCLGPPRVWGTQLPPLENRVYWTHVQKGLILPTVLTT